MANNPLIFNAVIAGATGGIHERWITQQQSSDYDDVRNAIVDFANTVDVLIPTDNALTQNDCDLMQSITQGVLASRYLQGNDSLLDVARAIVALWQALHGQVIPIPIVATGNEPGYVSRHVYTNAASTFIGQTYAGVTIEAAVTFTTPEQIPPGNWFTLDIFPPGGSGSGGRALQNATNDVPGGGGGGGSAHARIEVSRQELIARLPIVMTCPAAPAGGAAVNDNAGAYPDANVGTAGGQCSFGTLLTAFGGGGANASVGNPASTVGNGGGGGGIMSAGAGSAITSGANAGGDPLGVGGAQNSGHGGAGSSATSGAAGLRSMWGGASGGANRIATTNVGGIGGDSVYGAAGGAGGPCRNSTSAAAAQNGSAGGVSNFPINTSRAAGGLGTDGTGARVGQPGAPGAMGVFPYGGNGGGSGGDARSQTNGSTATGGAGGKGGFPGGGGGGGGPAIMGASAAFRTGTATSGPGGDGGDCAIVLTGYP